MNAKTRLVKLEARAAITHPNQLIVCIIAADGTVKHAGQTYTAAEWQEWKAANMREDDLTIIVKRQTQEEVEATRADNLDSLS